MKAKLTSIKAYPDTLEEVRNIVSNDSRLTIQSFYDRAAKEWIKLYLLNADLTRRIIAPELYIEINKKENNEQKNAGPANGRPNDSEGSEI